MKQSEIMPKRRTGKGSPKTEFQFIVLQSDKATGSQKRAIRSKAANHVYERRKAAFGAHSKSEVDSIQPNNPLYAGSKVSPRSKARVSHVKRAQFSYLKKAAGKKKKHAQDSDDETDARPSKALSIMPEFWLPSEGSRTDPYNSYPVVVNRSGHRILDFCKCKLLV